MNISPKVQAGGITGAAALVITWVAGQFGLDVPAEVAIAAVTLIGFIAGYMVNDPQRISPENDM